MSRRSWSGVPTLFAGMLRIAEEKIGQERVRRACHRLRLCISGGEILPAALLDRWKQFAGVEILDGVGTTEMTHMFILNRPGKSVPGSCGRIVSGYRAELVDDDETPVKTGEIGNLRVFGPSAAERYWNKPEKTAEVMGRGGVLTGRQAATRTRTAISFWSAAPTTCCASAASGCRRRRSKARSRSTRQ